MNMSIRGKPTGRGVLKEDGQGNVLRTDDVKQLDKNIKKVVRIKSADNAKVLILYRQYKVEQGGQETASFNIF